MGWLVPLAIGMAAVNWIGKSRAHSQAKKQYAADKELYEEQLKAQRWREIESLLRGGMGVSSPIRPPTKPAGMNFWDVLQSLAPAAALYGQYGAGGGSGGSVDLDSLKAGEKPPIPN